jgi:hypothetical protein
VNCDDVFEVWAPSDACWSAWAKPVLFATMPDGELQSAEPAPSFEFDWASGTTAPNTAWVVDLPGKDSVAFGLALAARGIRPVPLFNALPGGETGLVDVDGIQDALIAGVGALRAAGLALDAPPAFLLDALRRARPSRLPVHRFFDNRSLSFSTDFPSASALQAAGIQRVVLIRRGHLPVSSDLIETFAAFHAGGLAIEVLDAAAERPPLAWSPPSLLWLHRFWHRTLAALALERDDDSGAFGGWRRGSG